MTNTLERLKATTVFISGPDGTGTGYLVSSNRIATANHVVRSWEESMRYPVTVGVDGVVRQAQVLKRDPTTDVALLGIDSPVNVNPFPIGIGLIQNVTWDGYGFPQSGESGDTPAGLPLDGLVKDPLTRNNVSQPAILLYSDMAAAGNASPLNGFSGSAVVVADTLVGHLTKHIGDVDDLRRPRYGYVFACPIEAVAALFDFKPNKVAIRATIAHSIGDSGTLEQYRSAYLGVALEALEVRVAGGHASELKPVLQSLEPNLRPLIRPGEKIAVENVDKYVGGHLTRAAQARRQSAYHAGKQRGGSIENNISRLCGEESTLRQRIRTAEALSPPYKPTQDQFPLFSGMSDFERARRHEMQIAEYQIRFKKYEQAQIDYQRVIAELPAHRQQLSQIEQQISQRRIELSGFKQSLEANLSQLEREIEVARGQDIVQHLADSRDAAQRDLLDGSGAPRGFSKLMICNASAIVLRPWINDSFSAFQAVVNDIGALLTHTTREFAIDLALDCLTHCQVVLDTLERNGTTLREIGSVLERSSRKDLELSLSEIRKLRVLPLPSSTPPKPNLLARTDYDQILGTIDRATEQIQSIRERLARHHDLNAGLLKKARLGMDAVDQLKVRMLDEESRVQGVIDDLSFIWVDLCAHERISLLPRNVFDFIVTVQNEVARRHSLTIGELVERCQTSRFLLEDAETRITNDPSAVLLREHREISSHFGALDDLTAAYANARDEASKAANGLVAKIWQIFRK